MSAHTLSHLAWTGPYLLFTRFINTERRDVRYLCSYQFNKSNDEDQFVLVFEPFTSSGRHRPIQF